MRHCSCLVCSTTTGSVARQFVAITVVVACGQQLLAQGAGR